MLVLTRKSGEEIIIGDDIRIQVLETNGSRVRIGITAPRNVAVHRPEVAFTIDATRPQVIDRGEARSA